MKSIQLFVVFFKHMHITLPSESQVDQTGWQHNPYNYYGQMTVRYAILCCPNDLYL